MLLCLHHTGWPIRARIYLRPRHGDIYGSPCIEWQVSSFCGELEATPGSGYVPRGGDLWAGQTSCGHNIQARLFRCSGSQSLLKWPREVPTLRSRIPNIALTDHVGPQAHPVSWWHRPTWLSRDSSVDFWVWAAFRECITQVVAKARCT